MRWLLDNGVVPKTVMNGGKILSMDIPKLNMKFRDSLNYNPQSLAKWPETFGITDVAKGQFPHKFNRPENWNRMCQFPGPEEYGVASMRGKEKDAFLMWHKEEKLAKNGYFDFWNEIVSYCSLDVIVLRRCCTQFRSLFMDISKGMCPFATATTIAGLCNKFWRTHVLKKNQIGLLPATNTNRLQSDKAFRWLEFKAWEDDCHIQHRNSLGGEVKIGNFFVDGFAATNGTVYEFYGCWYHGCPDCFPKDTVHPLRKLPMGQIYEETVRRQSHLERLGHQVETIWEHTYDRMMKVDEDFKNFCAGVTLSTPVHPRDAFYGGRTNAFKLHHQVEGEEKIKYFDVCSEYPFVNKYKCYPIGHPQILRENIGDLSEYFGIVKCTVLPPSDLLLPVLPYRSNGKLTFPLCRACIESHFSLKCEHSDNERCLSGTWCTPELEEAVARGYCITRMLEVWHFPEQEERLFQPYIDKFLKLKTEASGWPADVVSDTDKDRYISEYLTKEGVALDKIAVKENPGMRALAKLCLNR